jgi:hypothetical protein
MTNPLILTAIISDQTVDVSVPAPPTLNFTPTPGAALAVVTVEGPAGPIGPPGTGAFIAREIPTGTIDGTNTTFTLAHNFQAGTTSVYLNGLLEMFCNELAPNQIQFSDPPHPGDAIRVSYTAS